MAVILRKQHILYHGSAVQDDEVEVRTWVYDVKRVRFTRYYALSRVSDGAPLAEVHCYYVLADRATLQPVRFPPGFMKSFEANVAPDAG